MTTDAVALRAELKSFERDFKANHGRAPGVDDIKKAGLADRYKLYKKLSKPDNATSSSSFPLPTSAKPIGRPSTPPRSLPRKPEASSSIIPKSRAVRTEIISSSNPFSPVKDRGKQKLPAPLSPSGLGPLPNPFATPRKAKSAQRPSARPLSPDPFPLIEAPTAAHPPSQQPAPSNPVLRARKRLRGEPVSPSPVKEKRQRVASSSVLPFPKLSTFTADDSDNDDHLDMEQANSSFVADSPMKAPPKGASFKLLFEEDASAQPDARALSKPGLARSKTTPANNGLFGTRSQRARSMSRTSDDVTESDNHQKPEMNDGDRKADKDAQRRKTKAGKRQHINGFSFSRDNLFDAAETSAPAGQPSRQSQASSSAANSSHSRSSAKRSLSDTEMDGPESTQPRAQLPLLPPSPPPAGSGSGSSYKGKGKAKAVSRKKAKVIEDIGEEEDEDSLSDTHVKVREWSWKRREEEDGSDARDIDFDPVLGLGAHDRLPNAPTPGPASDDEPGEFEVNLPDDLRRILAISPSKAHEADEVGVVRGVLYGVRTAHYDGLKGGDIWDAGETGDGTEGEEDWEGEPVPWETGEL